MYVKNFWFQITLQLELPPLSPFTPCLPQLQRDRWSWSLGQTAGYPGSSVPSNYAETESHKITVTSPEEFTQSGRRRSQEREQFPFFQIEVRPGFTESGEKSLVLQVVPHFTISLWKTILLQQKYNPCKQVQAQEKFLHQNPLISSASDKSKGIFLESRESDTEVGGEIFLHEKTL